MIWKFRLKEAASIYETETRSHAVAFVDTFEPKWKGWTFAETERGVEMAPPTRYCTLFVPYENLFFVTRRDDPSKAPKKA